MFFCGFYDGVKINKTWKTPSFSVLGSKLVLLRGSFTYETSNLVLHIRRLCSTLVLNKSDDTHPSSSSQQLYECGGMDGKGGKSP